MSVLGERMTAFVRLVYQLPVSMEAEPDWEDEFAEDFDWDRKGGW